MIRNCLTVDVEEWFHICGVGGPLGREHWHALPSRVVDNTRHLLDLLDTHGARATFFVLGWVADRHPQLVTHIAEAGHEIGSHGQYHTPVYELLPEAFAEDLDCSLRALRHAGAASVKGFRAPQWSINDRSLWALEILAQKGFRFDSSLAPLKIIGNPSYPWEPHARPTPQGDLVEFPPMVERRLGQNFPIGGGWGLRMTSPAHVLRRIEERNRAGTPVALFVHPWEIDPDPPRVRLPWTKTFVHYFRLDGFKSRLAAVLAGTRFAPMGEVLGLAAPA